MMKSGFTLFGLAALTMGCASQTAIRPSITNVSADRYVAMGSSFAAGPGLAAADATPTRCGRSLENYAHVLARRRHLALTDVSCSGATTAHVLGSWNELPAQVEALTPQTALVTITVGGNDVGYIGGLMSQACYGVPAPDRPCRRLPPATERDWTALEQSLGAIADEVYRRAPRARLVFIGYLTVTPADRPCENVPLAQGELISATAKAARLSAMTANVARRKGALFLDAGAMSADHDACAPEPWTSGFPTEAAPVVGVPFHANRAGMAAIAQALDRLLTG